MPYQDLAQNVHLQPIDAGATRLCGENSGTHILIDSTESVPDLLKRAWNSRVIGSLCEECLDSVDDWYINII